MAAVSIEGKIFEALAAVLTALSWVKSVEYERPRIVAGDWLEHELPAVQFFDNRAQVTHAKGDIYVQWALSIEMILKATATNAASQTVLFDRKKEIEDAIGANVDLGIPGMQHLRFDGWETDTTEEPYFVCRLDFTALYKKPFTGC